MAETVSPSSDKGKFHFSPPPPSDKRFRAVPVFIFGFGLAQTRNPDLLTFLLADSLRPYDFPGVAAALDATLGRIRHIPAPGGAAGFSRPIIIPIGELRTLQGKGFKKMQDQEAVPTKVRDQRW